MAPSWVLGPQSQPEIQLIPGLDLGEAGFSTEHCFYLHNYFIVPRVRTKNEVIKISLIRTYITRVGACRGDGSSVVLNLHKILLQVNQAPANSKQSQRIYELSIFLFSTH